MWFGVGSAGGVVGAEKALNSPVPEGITERTLLIYQEIAQRAIDSGVPSSVEVQTIRLEAIKKALGAMHK